MFIGESKDLQGSAQIARSTPRTTRPDHRPTSDFGVAESELVGRSSRSSCDKSAEASATRTVKLRSPQSVSIIVRARWAGGLALHRASSSYLRMLVAQSM